MTAARTSFLPGRPTDPRPGSRGGGGVGLGFSLLEVLVATVILATGIAIVTGALATNQVTGARARRQSTAYDLAADVLDRAAAGELKDRTEGERTEGPVAFGWRLEWVADDAPLRRLRCVVSWADRGADRQVALERNVLAGATEGGP